jgi:8-oxo-dGTP pyrophosphatase MutT (NUDIX family)
VHRKRILALLDRYGARHPDESVTGRLRAFVEEHADCFERSCVPGHITGSAWILSPDGERALLTHHRKLERWLQLGGHVDGSSDVPAAALREAQEESGIAAFEWVYTSGESDLVPLDLDIHEIPARGSEPAHEHYDVRFLLRATTDEIKISDESHDLRWFTPEEIERVSDEESLLRMVRKVRARGRGRRPGR